MLYARLPSEKELENTGFTPSDYEEQAEVWPENWLVFSLFSMMNSQWDSGFDGPTGLKYQVLFELMDRQKLADDEWWEVFAEIRKMESAALTAMSKSRPA